MERMFIVGVHLLFHALFHVLLLRLHVHGLYLVLKQTNHIYIKI